MKWGKSPFLSTSGMKERKWHCKGIDHLDQKEHGWESAVVSARMRDAFKVYGLNMPGFFLFF